MDMNKIPSAQELTELYVNRKFSLSEIATKLDISVHKVLYWMNKYQLPRRKQREANYLKHNPNGDPFFIKKKLTRDEIKLKYLALGLYWGEGSKSSLAGIRITNSDPGVIKQFLKYMTQICRARDDKIHFYLQTFKDNNTTVAKNYWAEQLSIDPSRINTGKPIPSMGKGTYKNISVYGVMTLGFYNTHLQSHIMNDLRKLGLK